MPYGTVPRKSKISSAEGTSFAAMDRQHDTSVGGGATRVWPQGSSLATEQVDHAAERRRWQLPCAPLLATNSGTLVRLVVELPPL